MFADLPDLLAIEDDDDEVTDVEMADATIDDIGGLSDNVSFNDSEGNGLGKEQSKDSVSKQFYCRRL